MGFPDTALRGRAPNRSLNVIVVKFSQNSLNSECLAIFVCNSDFMRPPLRGHGPHGELRLHAAAPQFQASKFGLCRGQKKEFNDAHISASATGLFRSATSHFRH